MKDIYMYICIYVYMYMYICIYFLLRIATLRSRYAFGSNS